MGRTRKIGKRAGGDTIVGTVKGGNAICRFVRGQGNPALYDLPQNLFHHYPIPKSRFFSHVHVLFEPPSEFLPRRISQSSRQSHPRWYRQVLHPVRRKFRRRPISLSYRLRKLLERYRVLKIVSSLRILRMQRLQPVRQIFQFEFRLLRPVKETVFRQIVLMPLPSHQFFTRLANPHTWAYPSGDQSVFIRLGASGSECHGLSNLHLQEFLYFFFLHSSSLFPAPRRCPCFRFFLFT